MYTRGIFFTGTGIGSGAIGAVLCCVFPFLMAIGIASLVIGLQNPHKDNPCMKEDKIGLYLDEWLIGRGIANIVTFSILWLILVFSSHIQEDIVSAVCGILCALYALFGLIWLVIGIVVLARSSNACVDQGNDAAIMAIVAFVLNIF